MKHQAMERPDRAAALALAEHYNLDELIDTASNLRDAGHQNLITFSKKVFIPLTHLCRDVCHYCTFAKTPRHIAAAFMPIEQILDVARRGAEQGCKEALFTLGEKPELRYRAARTALDDMGYASTLEYLCEAARLVYEETGLLPHLNPGTMTEDEANMLRPVAPSMGLMLESVSPRLMMRGMPHFGSPDKSPLLRLATLEVAGKAKIPTTSGILIGIGETRRERIESLLALRDLNDSYGHLQEIIVQPFRAKSGTKMEAAAEPGLDDLLWTIAATRIVFGAHMNIQAPPNLSPGDLHRLIAAGINDWGGVSPVTPDFVNPEAPWPHLEELRLATESAGKHLLERLTIYPEFVRDADIWADEVWRTPLLRRTDANGLPRVDMWSPGMETAPPKMVSRSGPKAVTGDVEAILAKAQSGRDIDEAEIIRLFNARGDDYAAVTESADTLRRDVNGDTVTYVVNRNINYTNLCYFHCKFCAFSKGKTSEELRGNPYDLSLEEIMRRTNEAWASGATEVCMQGGIHPRYTGDTYLDIVRAVKRTAPDIHVHAFSPLEVWQGAATLGLPLRNYLLQLKSTGLNTLPGTAAEILDDEVRAIICPDKISTDDWLEVMEAAHGIGLRSTATIMFGHIDRPVHWARHLLRIRDLQIRTGGFTEFVPLPFVHMEAPMYNRGGARMGPTWQEAILMHAVSRLALHPYISNIQASWVKMGELGAIECLNSGCNDLGGTLMNESISRAAGAQHGQETTSSQMVEIIAAAGRTPLQRNTLYGEVSAVRASAGFNAGPCEKIVNTPIQRPAVSS